MSEINFMTEAAQMLHHIFNQGGAEKAEAIDLAYEMGAAAWMGQRTAEETRPVLHAFGDDALKMAFLRGIKAVIDKPGNQWSTYPDQIRPFVTVEMVKLAAKPA